MKASGKFLVAGAMLLFAFVAFKATGDYNYSKPMTLTVVAEYHEPGGYRRYGGPVMVLRTEDGRVFDRRVSYSTITLYKPGDRIVMNLRRLDIRQSGTENLLNFLMVVFASFGISAVLMAGLCWPDD